MICLGTGLQHALIAVLTTTLLSACAARDPVAHVDPADVRCPDLSGSYCVVGQMYERGATQVSSISLPWFLPVADQDTEGAQNILAADRVELTGGHDGQLQITLSAVGQTVYSMRLDAAGFRCGVDTLLLENAGQMWGGMGPPLLPIIGVGWSDAHSLFWKGADGSLRARKLRRNSGTVMLAIPVNINEEFWARFRPADEGCDEP
jgi:hypothetical protein